MIALTGRALRPMSDPTKIPIILGRSFFDYLLGYMFEVFLYGINIMLFSGAAFILVRKGKGFTRWLLLASVGIMFAIATANICLSIYVIFGILIYGSPFSTPVLRSKHMLYLVNNVIADTLLIYRCYSIWSRSLYIIAFPCTFLLGTSLSGIVVMTGPVLLVGRRKTIYLWLTLFLNILVTALTATRVWWMAHKARTILGPGLARRYYSTLAIIIESGAIYSLYVLVDQVLVALKVQSFVLDAGLAQIVVIAPTLIVVQLGLGRHIRDLETNLRLSRGPSVQLSTVHSDCV